MFQNKKKAWKKFRVINSKKKKNKIKFLSYSLERNKDETTFMDIKLLTNTKTWSGSNLTELKTRRNKNRFSKLATRFVESTLQLVTCFVIYEVGKSLIKLHKDHVPSSLSSPNTFSATSAAWALACFLFGDATDDW